MIFLAQQYSLNLKVNYFDLETPAIICILNINDARKLGVVPDDRVLLTNPKNNQFIAAVVDVAKTMIKENEIGIPSVVKKELNLDDQAVLKVTRSEKPKSFTTIKKKIEGKTLTFDEIKELVEEIKHNKVSTVELTSFVTAVKIKGYSIDETYAMAKCIADSGKKLDLKVDGTIVDKHSIGGINGRATMICVPIVANFNSLFIPKTSSRAITSPAGTADAMEILADVNLDIKRLREVVLKTHGSIVWGGSFDFAPVDDKIIQIERPLRLDPQGQVIASVLSKKLAVGAQKLVVDIPTGKDMKVKTLPEAEDIAGKFISVGKKLGIDVRGIITNGNVPCGNTFGCSLEAKTVMEILEGKYYDNLAEKSCELAGHLLELSGVIEKGKGTSKARDILKSGKALKKMKEIINAQGKRIDSSKDIPYAEYSIDILANSEGYIQNMGVYDFITIALGAGAPFDKYAGVEIKQRLHSAVNKGDLLFTIYANNKDKLQYAESLAKKLQPIKLEDIVLEEVS